MPDPLCSTDGTLAPHWNTLIGELAPYLHPRSSTVALRPTSVGEQIIASFSGEVVRRATRHRGGPVPIVPLRDLKHSWEVWIGYREVWTLLGRRNRFAFSSSDITVFFSISNSGSFQQILRAEWTGLAKEVQGWAFRPNNAGHPHWQIDVTEVLLADNELEAARRLLREVEPREFGTPQQATLQYPPWYEIGRMHLASAMRPWVDSRIAHGPTGLGAVRTWVVHTIQLLNVELARL
jgi:hypothetical protein